MTFGAWQLILCLSALHCLLLIGAVSLLQQYMKLPAVPSVVRVILCKTMTN